MPDLTAGCFNRIDEPRPRAVTLSFAVCAALGVLAAVFLLLGPTAAAAQPSPDRSGPEVTRAVACLAGNGRVDHTFVNTTSSTAAYRVEFEGLTARQIQVAPGDWGRISLTGRADNTYETLVLRNGVVIRDDAVTVACDASPAVSTPEITVITSCRADAGYVLLQIVNATDTAKPYIIRFDSVPNRSITIAPYGAGVRAVTARPDGSYALLVTSEGAQVLATDVQVSCNPPDPDDNDGDGIPNDADPDDDNDGIADQTEIDTGTDPLAAADCSESNRRSGADLHACDFAQASMDGIDLRGAQLTFANLEGASLIRADLTGADLQFTNLVRADLTEAVLVQTVAERAVMSGATLARADLTQLRGRIDAIDTDFSHATLDSAFISNSDLTGSDFTEASVRGVTMARARLNRAVLVDADLSDSNAEGAEMMWANLERATLDRLNLAAATLTGAIASNASFIGASAAFASLASTDLTGANFQDAQLVLAVFISADLHDADLTTADLESAIWGGTTCPDGTNSDDLPYRSCEPCPDACSDTRPVFLTPNGLTVSEGGTSQFVLTATNATSYGVIAGLDAERFDWNQSGLIRFKEPTDFETPRDYDDDNVYLINVIATNISGDPTREQSIGMTLAITVTDLPD